MRDLLAAFGALFLFLIIWFLASWSSFDAVQYSAHVSFIQAVLHGEITQPTPHPTPLTRVIVEVKP